MSKSIVEERSELFHYTDAAGLAGIIQSQTLWATHYAYLNDSEEIKYFHKTRLPKLLQGVVGIRLNELIEQDSSARLLIEREGGKEKRINPFVKEILGRQEDILWSCRDDKEPLSEPYIISFCSTKHQSDQVVEHGLLSQWRGYGRDGSYAIVFDTACFSRLLTEVGKKWGNSGYLFCGDIVYSSDSDSRFLEEFEEDLDVIRNFSLDCLRGIEDSKNVKNIFSALMKCSCRYKHWGFKEENEVRIIAVPHNMGVCELVGVEDGIVIKKIPRKYYLRSGVLEEWYHILIYLKALHPLQKNLCQLTVLLLVPPRILKKEQGGFDLSKYLLISMVLKRLCSLLKYRI